MNKKKIIAVGTLFFTLITILAILYSISSRAGWIGHKSHDGFDYGEYTIKDTDVVSWIDNIGNGDQVYDEVYDTLSAFSKVEVDVEVSDVHIQYGPEYFISCAYKGSDKKGIEPEWEVDDGCLKVKQRFHSKGGDNVCSIVIEIPEDAKLDELDIKVEIGSLYMNDITFSKLDCDSNIGDCNIDGVTCKKICAKLKMGEMYVMNSTVDEIDADSKIGDITITDVFDNQDNEPKLSLETGLGSVYIDGVDFGDEYD